MWGPGRRPSSAHSESASVGLTVHERQAAGQKWSVTTVMAGDLLPLSEIGVEIPIAEIYEDVDFAPPAPEAWSQP